MKKVSSLTLRLTLLFGITAAIVFSGFGWFIERSIDHHFVSGDTAELKVIARAVSQSLEDYHVHLDSKNRKTALEQKFNAILLGHHSAALYIIHPNETIFFTSLNGPDLPTLRNNNISNPPPLSAYNDEKELVQHWHHQNHLYRVLTQKMQSSKNTENNAYTLLVAITIDHHRHFLNSFRNTLWLMIGIGIIVMGLLSWIAVHQGHAPLHNLVAQIRRTSANQLNTRLPPESVPRELTDLAISFNDMLERMDESFQRLSNFSADIAHELRTPITSMLTQTQVILSQTRNSEEYREALYSNIEEYERIAKMISDMLFLAKADNGQYQTDNVTIHLNKEIMNLFEYYEAWAEEFGVKLNLTGSAKISGDRLMIQRLLSNILSNAIRHTPAGNTVQVNIRSTTEKNIEQQVTIAIENPGEMIPAQHIPKLFDRFYRVDASRSRNNEGAGLGLAIARSIVEIHAGTIKVSSTKQSTLFQITLPALIT